MSNLARELEELVLRMPAVTALYGGRAVVADVVERVGSTVRSTKASAKAGSARTSSRLSPPVHRVGVQTAEDETTVTLSVGIDGSASAIAAAEQITSAIAAHVAESGLPAASTRLTIAYVGARTSVG